MIKSRKWAEKRVCFNCDNYRAGLCDVREHINMERGANSCPDWTVKKCR